MRVRGKLAGTNCWRHNETIQVPPVSELLEVDREYRAAVARGGLRRIAPRRFNPAQEA